MEMNVNVEQEERQSAASEPADAQALADEALDTTRRALMVSYRFLDLALWRMEPQAREGIELMGTDGRTVFYNPEEILRRYAASPDELARDYLHMVLHCIFYHPFIGNDVSPFAWNLAADIVVEEACIGLAGERFRSEHDVRRSEVIESLHARLGSLSAERLYRDLVSSSIQPAEALALSALFARDDHGAWFHDKDPQEQEEGEEKVESQESTQREVDPEGKTLQMDEPQELPDPQGGGSGGQSSNGESSRSQGNGNGQRDGDDSGQHEDGDTAEGEQQPQPPERAPQAQPEEAREDQGEETKLGEEAPQERDGPDGSGKEEWEQISKQIKVDLETHSNRYGSKAGALLMQLRVENRRRYDYREFLRRFAELGEEMAINDEEFDLVYYTYGLRTYGNLPLVEPLEYREAEKVREFVIAIDTSGSVEGPLVKRFVEETYSILKSSESFFSQVNVHIMQCDARLQSDVAIHSEEEFERYMRNFQLAGFGGTDFRPVFSRVDALVEAGEFENLKGLVYFTDGYGTFPKAPPAYETVFVFARDDAYLPEVPAWAMRLALDPADIQ